MTFCGNTFDSFLIGQNIFWNCAQMLEINKRITFVNVENNECFQNNECCTLFFQKIRVKNLSEANFFTNKRTVGA